jgi:membrane associated rhomboid family serine protease
MTYRTYRGGMGDMLTPGVRALLLANAVGYLLQTFFDAQMVYLFGLRPADFWAEHAIWQPVTYMFLHGGLMHLAFNMLALWMFGSALESFWGTRFFVRYYFITGVGAGLCNALITPGSEASIIGASGAVYGLLAAYGILFPNNIIYAWLFVPIRAKYMVLIFGAVEFVASLRPDLSPIAHLVHLGGMIIGVIYLRWSHMIFWLRRKGWEWIRERDHSRRRKINETEDKLRIEADDLLDKINEVGIGNLTSWERRRLKEITDRLNELHEQRR